jgi:hypothetical protein
VFTIQNKLSGLPFKKYWCFFHSKQFLHIPNMGYYMSLGVMEMYIIFCYHSVNGLVQIPGNQQSYWSVQNENLMFSPHLDFQRGTKNLKKNKFFKNLQTCLIKSGLSQKSLMS